MITNISRPRFATTTAIALGAAFLFTSKTLYSQSTKPAADPLARAAQLEAIGDFPGAARALEAWLLQKPGDGSARIRAGLLWSRGDYYEPAEKLLSKAVELDTKDREAWLALGEARLRGQKYHSGIVAFEKAASLGDSDGRAANGKGLCYYYLGDIAAAKPLLLQAAKTNSNLIGPRHTIGRIALDEGDLDGAIRYFRECLTLDSRDADSYFYLGLALRQKASFEDAIVAFRAAIAADPLHTGARLNLGQVLILLKREDEGRAEIEAHGKIVRGKQQLTFAMNSLRLEPASPRSRVRVGDALLELGIAPEALLQYREALRAKKPPASAFLGAAKACRALGETNAQIQYAKKAVEAFEREPAENAADLALARELLETPASKPVK
ncbi:MAG: tetratricopeptide repeat protein [Planctomycetota bacterium]